MGNHPVDLELEISGIPGAYIAEMRIDRGMDSVTRYGPWPIGLDRSALDASSGNPDQYGNMLTEMLFSSSGIRDVFSTARGMALAQNLFFRLRLVIGPGASDLHQLHWELLCLPGTGERLSTREDILFSPYLPTQRDAPPPNRKESLRALVAIASPDDSGKHGMSVIAVSEEVDRARTGLSGIDIDWLPGSPTERCTLQRLIEQIPEHDVLYLVCHGKMIGGAGWVLLENEDGSAARISASDLSVRLAGSRELPRLAILVVCESAGSSNGTVLGALGPRLVELGIPAVLAMQGSLTFSSAKTFLPHLFRELRKDGLIDRAVSVARRSISEQPEQDTPILFMSLKSGLLWATERGEKSRFAPVHQEQKGDLPISREPMDPVKLYQSLNSEVYSLEDLEELCFTLHVDWEFLQGQTKPAKARAMIRYFTSRGRLGELVDALRQARPNLDL